MVKKVQANDVWAPQTPQKSIGPTKDSGKHSRIIVQQYQRRQKNNEPCNAIQIHEKYRIKYQRRKNTVIATLKKGTFQKQKHSNLLDAGMLDVIDKGRHISESGGQLVVHNRSAHGQVWQQKAAIVYNKQKPPPKVPKVDVDQETMWVWKLPMANGGQDVEVERDDQEEKKCQEDQRNTLHGRVDSFISRMHLIQGDRRFSPWKGSVVDSVAGVFLTQNVSDHLSGSAFMSLAAKYPVRSTTASKVGDEDGQSTPYPIGCCSKISPCTKSPLRKKKTKVTKSPLRKKKSKVEQKQEKPVDWDELRKKYIGCTDSSSTSDTMDSLDWEEVRRAKIVEVRDAIKGRGQQNVLAERIKEFLDRVVRDHGSINLEWLRTFPPEKAKEYLLSFQGLGLKSVECVRLLTLQHHAFPVDTNVRRVAVRLGWVPLKPLPDSLQFHLLEQYPDLDSVQKYLCTRLCTLDQLTKYELHYQMITFGKVFCRKRRPNCNACPMKGECRHFASAFPSSRLALPGPQETSSITSIVPYEAVQNSSLVITPATKSLPAATFSESRHKTKSSEAINEHSPSPEPESLKYLERDIEDLYDEPEGVSQLRSRTIHHVYELPDSHCLLEGFDKREPDDKIPYTLAIWPSGGTAISSSKSPGKLCDSSEESHLCNRATCSSCNDAQDQNVQTVCGTILIPCRTATRGRFPLNGTYFQVNEVFADDETSQHALSVPRALLGPLIRKTLYCGAVAGAIFDEEVSTNFVRKCFWRGLVCVRAFNRRTRMPSPLAQIFHSSTILQGKRKFTQDE